MSGYLNFTKTLTPLELAEDLLAKAENFGGKPRRLFLACSGGIDSMVLLALIGPYAKAHGLPLTVLHVNYGLRGEESDGDEAFVRSSCETLGVAVKVLKAEPNPKGQVGLQNWARQIRYDWFHAEAGPEDRVLLAHHRDDLIETILMRVVRGSALSGLMGMKKSEGKFLRLLLDLSRQDIEELARRNQVAFREDSSNAKLDYSRNRLRHKILPELESMFPGTGHNLLELAKSGQEWTQFFQDAMQRRSEPENPAEWRDFGFSPASQLILSQLQSFLNEEFSATKPSRPWLEAIYDALCNDSSTVLQLGPELSAKVSQGRVSFQRNPPENKVSPRWLQFQAELTKAGLASRLSPGARLDVELDAGREMQDNKNVRASPK